MLQQKKFIGPRGVDVCIETDIKTYTGGEVIRVQYDGGYSEIMPRKTFELLVSDEPTDLTKIREKKFIAIYQDLYKIFADYCNDIANDFDDKKNARTQFLTNALAALGEHDLKSSEIEPLLNATLAEFQGAINSLINEFDNTFNRATNFLWTKNDKEFTPGMNMMLERTLLEAKQVCEQIPESIVEQEIPADDAATEETTK